MRTTALVSVDRYLRMTDKPYREYRDGEIHTRRLRRRRIRRPLPNLSPEAVLGATLAMCEEYHAWGVPFTWVIDPVKRAAWEYPSKTASQPALRTRSEPAISSSASPISSPRSTELKPAPHCGSYPLFVRIN